MNFKQLKNKIKEEQKQLAKEIRELKNQRKSSPCGYVSGLDKKRFDYRHRHIAYCQLFFNTPYERVELYCHEEPMQSLVDMYMDRWRSEIEQ